MNKKLMAQVLALSCILFSLASCGKEKKKDHKDDKVFVPIETQKVTVQDISTKNIHKTWGGKLPSYLYDSGPILEIDYLLWRTDCEKLNYANVINRTTDAAGITTSSTRPQKTDFGVDSGFRVALGYTFSNQDQWDLMAIYTYFHNSEEDSTDIPLISTVGIMPLVDANYIQSPYLNQFMGDFLQTASADWRLNYNVADLELGRNFFIGRQLSIRPHWGVRGAWLYQDQTIYYTGYNMLGGTQAAPTLSNLISTQLNNQNDWHGVGLRTGAEMSWGFSKHWALVGSFSAALFYGRFVVRQDAAGVVNNSAGSTVPYLLKYREGFNAIRPQLDASLGFEVSQFFCSHRYRVAFTAVWEIQEWFEQNVLTQTYSFVDTYPDSTARSVLNNQMNTLDGNLGIQGLTLKLRFDF